MRFKQLVEETGEGIVVADAETRMVRYANPAACRMLGYSPTQIRNLRVDALHRVEDVERMLAEFRTVLRNPGRRLEDAPFLRADGSLFLADINASIMNLAGRPCVVGFLSDNTERRRVQAALRHSQALLNEAQVVAGLGNWDLDLETGQALWSDEEYRLLGYEPGTLTASKENFLRAVHPDDRDRVMAEMARAMRQEENHHYRVQFRVLQASGERIVEDQAHVAFAPDGRPLRMFGTTLDITERHLALHAAMQRNLEMEAIFKALPDLYFRVGPDGTLLDYRANGLHELYAPPEKFLGRRIQDVLPPEPTRLFLERQGELQRTGEMQTYEFPLQLSNGLRIFEARLTPLAAQSQDLVAVVRDVTERKRAEEEIRYRANFDQLTGLPNRELLVERLTQAIRQARRDSRRLALLFVDLDHFKQVNDTLGHTLGDRLLQQAAERLKNCVRESDTVARQGGDEFVVLLQGIDQPRDAAQVAGKIISQLRDPFLLDDHVAHIGASIGITHFPEDGEDVLSLFRNADLAMYRAKDGGRNSFQFFEPAMTQAAMQRRSMESDLRLALDRGEFRLHYQPIYQLAGARLVGVEALLRWPHPRRGLVPPVDFIALAEETGLIRELGIWVLKQVCRQLAQWRDQGLDFYVSVNISSRQIPDALPLAWLQDLLAGHGLTPDRLVLEITEGVLLADTTRTQTWLEEARHRGFRISLDDFGTGYSSLAYLKRFPVDQLKIDRTFVGDMHRDPADRSLVEAILAMARSLGLEVIAEGVENAEQLALLRRMGCLLVQGHHFSPAIRAEDIGNLLLSLA